ncbi:hypothetical protein, partial [Devosia sp.]|uniref:hypothetical protein n=1 Tax=Devosia sp. TaxID=1871048 RepID=UPI002EDE9B65
MDGPKILASYREELAEHLKAYTPPQSIALPISPWLAMSILQKAVRRGRRDLALQAAATLLQDAPDRLWRRLGTVAYEDVGVPSLATVGLVTAALVGKQFRATVGGEWAVASFLVDRLVAAPKNRGADDLYMVCERHPSFRSARQELAHLDIDRLIVLATGNAELPLRALAAWFALGTDRCPSPYLATRRGKPDRLLDVFCETGYQHTAYELGREAFRKIGLPHCIFVPMLLAIRPHVPAEIADD